MVLLGCGIDFSTRYDRIEENRVRPLAFVYDNNGLAEASPGDSVWCTVYFAGEQVNTIDFSITSSLIINRFGRDTFADTVSLDRYLIPETYMEFFGGETDSVKFRFIVPAEIIRNHFARYQDIGSLFPPSVSDTVVPKTLRDIKPSEIIDVIELLTAGEISSESVSNPFNIATYDTDIQNIVTFLPMLLQVFTVNIKIFALVNNHYLTESTFSVRYNSRLAGIIPAIPVNHNPSIDWIRCCRVKSNKLLFDPIKDSALIDTVYELYPGCDTIQIDTGYRYFLAADTLQFIDSCFSITDSAMSRQPERFSCEWFFQNSGTSQDMSVDSLVSLGVNFTGSSIEITPPVDTRLRRVNIWLVMYDSFLGERLRPVGFSLKGVRCIFSYSDEYVKKYRK